MHLRHAIQESLRLVLDDAARCFPVLCAQWRGRNAGIALHSVQQTLAAWLTVGDASPRTAVMRDHRRTAQGQRNWQWTRRRRQPKYWLDLAGQFVRKEQTPAATERQSTGNVPPGGRCIASTQSRPVRIEAIQEFSRQGRAAKATGHPIGVKAQAGTIGEQQQVPSRQGIAPCHALQQHRISLRIEAMQGQQVQAR